MKRLTMVRSLNRCRCQPNVLPAQNAILYSMANFAGMPVYSKWITFPCNSRLARLQSRLQFQFQSQSLSPCSYLPANKYMCNAFITLQTNKCKCKCKCCCTILQSPLLCMVHTSIYVHCTALLHKSQMLQLCVPFHLDMIFFGLLEAKCDGTLNVAFQCIAWIQMQCNGRSVCHAKE